MKKRQKRSIYVNLKKLNINKSMKAMILAAGMGTRLRPLTLNKPKALVEIRKKPMIAHAIDYLAANGIFEIIINVHHFSDQIIDYVKDQYSSKYNIVFSHEENQLMDTGGGIKKAESFLAESNPFLVMAMDIITSLDISDMMTYHKAHQSMVTLAVKERTTSRSLLFSEQSNKLIGWRDERTREIKWVNEKNNRFVALGFSGIHLIHPHIFSLMPDNKPFSITDFYLDISSAHDIRGFRHDHDSWEEFGRLENIQ